MDREVRALRDQFVTVSYSRVRLPFSATLHLPNFIVPFHPLPALTPYLT